MKLHSCLFNYLDRSNKYNSMLTFIPAHVVELYT